MSPPETITELRRRVQAPVRQYNDIAGYLIGDHVSIHLTRLFVRYRLSPTIATIAMLVFGLAGSGMILLGDAWAIGGFVCVFVYYICDCVDGEVARYHRREELIWGFYDYFFHLFVKSAFFFCMGIAAFRTTWELWVLVPAFTALLGTLFLKFLWDLPIAMASRHVLLKSRREHRRFLRQLLPDLDPGPAETPPVDPEALGLSSLGRPLSIVRATLTNFDLSILVFLCAGIADLVIPQFELFGQTLNFKVVVLCFYGIVMPLDFADQLYTTIRRRGFFEEASSLLRRAHHFRLRGRD